MEHHSEFYGYNHASVWDRFWQSEYDLESTVKIFLTLFLTGGLLAQTPIIGDGQGGSNGSPLTIANAGITGTTAGTLTKLTGAPSTALKAATTDTSGIVGITASGAGTSGFAQISTSGLINCIFSGSTTAGHYVQISSVTAGDCVDSGAGTYPASGQIIGRVLSTNVGAGTYQIDLFPQELQASTGGTITGVTAGTGLSGGGSSGGVSLAVVTPFHTIDVQNFGAVPDGTTDNTTALNNIFSTAAAGTEILFSCSGGGSYKVTGELHFTAEHTYTGSSSSSTCVINSTYSGNVAFEFKDAKDVVINHLSFNASNSTSPPKTIMAFGKSSSPLGIGSLFVYSSLISGYASVAMYYSIAYESQFWYNSTFNFSGGAATAIMIIDDTDSSTIDSFASGSNTNLHYNGVDVEDLRATPVTDYGVRFQNTGGNTGNITFRDGYIAQNGNGSGTSHGFGFWIDNGDYSIVIDGNRNEYATCLAQIATSAGIVGLTISNNTMSNSGGTASVVGMVCGNVGETINNYNEFGNQFHQSSLNATVGTHLGGVVDGFVIEPYLVTVATPTRVITNKGGGITTAAVISAGPTYSFGTNTCGATFNIGGPVGGFFHSGTTGTCTVTVNLGVTVPNSAACIVYNITTPADLWHVDSDSGSAITLKGTSVSGDTIRWGCPSIQ